MPCLMRNIVDFDGGTDRTSVLMIVSPSLLIISVPSELFILAIQYFYYSSLMIFSRSIFITRLYQKCWSDNFYKMEAPSTKRNKVEREADGQEAEKERLLDSLRKLADATNSVVDEARKDFREMGVEKYVNVPTGAGVRKLWSHVGNYIQCLRENCVETYSELEQLWKCHYGSPEVRDAVEDMLEAEERHEAFLKEVEGEFVKIQDGNEAVGGLKEGDIIPGNIEVIDARSKEARQIRTCWESSKTTLFVMLRHFG